MYLTDPITSFASVYFDTSVGYMALAARIFPGGCGISLDRESVLKSWSSNHILMFLEQESRAIAVRTAR